MLVALHVMLVLGVALRALQLAQEASSSQHRMAPWLLGGD